MPLSHDNTSNNQQVTMVSYSRLVLDTFNLLDSFEHNEGKLLRALTPMHHQPALFQLRVLL
jgi:hypothetical protein